MVKAQRILLKKGRKKAPNFSHQEFRRVEKSRVQRLETAQSHSLIAYLNDLKLRADNSENDSNVHKKHGHSSERPQVGLLSGIGSSMSFSSVQSLKRR